MAERASCGCVGSDRCCVASPPAREPDTAGGITATKFELSVFRLKTCGCPFERLCSSVASGLHCLSSDDLCAGGSCERLMWILVIEDSQVRPSPLRPRGLAVCLTIVGVLPEPLRILVGPVEVVSCLVEFEFSLHCGLSRLG